LLQKRGLQLIELPAGNFELAAYPGLLVKDSYWRWPQRDLAGNAIDFFMRVLGLSFHQAVTGRSAVVRSAVFVPNSAHNSGRVYDLNVAIVPSSAASAFL
jgi:hypothetical protein